MSYLVHPVHALMKLNVPNVTARGVCKGEGNEETYTPKNLPKLDLTTDAEHAANLVNVNV